MNEKAMQIAMILDRSGSMSTIEAATVEGMNAFLREQREGVGTAESPAIELLLVQFDDQYEQVYSGPIAGAPMFTLSEELVGNQVRFVPRGWTALLDAMGKTIDEVGRKLNAMPEEERPAKVVIVTMTDGMENRSKHYTQAKIAEIIQRQRDVYKWEFQFLAANQDAIQTANAMNIPAASAITYAAAPAATKTVMAAMSRGVRNYAGSGVAPSFTPADRVAAMAKEPEKAPTQSSAQRP